MLVVVEWKLGDQILGYIFHACALYTQYISLKTTVNLENSACALKFRFLLNLHHWVSLQETNQITLNWKTFKEFKYC